MEVDQPTKLVNPPVDKVIKKIVERSTKINSKTIQFSGLSRKALGQAAKYFTVYLAQSMQDIISRAEIESAHQMNVDDTNSNSNSQSEDRLEPKEFDLSTLSQVYNNDPRLSEFKKYFPHVMNAENALALSRKRKKYLDGDITDDEMPELVPNDDLTIEPKIEPEVESKVESKVESDEINSNSTKDPVEHLEDSMSAVDISSDHFVTPSPHQADIKAEKSKNSLSSPKKPKKVKKQTNIENFFAKKPKTAKN